MSGRIKRVLVTFLLAAVVVGVTTQMSRFGVETFGGRILESLGWLAGAFLANNLLVLLVWEGLLPAWTGRPIQKLVIQISGFTLVVVALGIIMVRVFEVPVTGVLTTSGIFIAIIGFALRNMISDLFTGIAIGIERPFSAGDWIQIADGTVGKVVEVNWRSTRLITREEITVIIPNSELAISTFKNFSMPERSWRDEFEILLPHDVTSHQAERVLLSAINQVPELGRVAKPPEVRIVRYTENGIVWSARYWVPDYPDMSRLRYEVQKAANRNMHYAGLRVPGERIEVEPTRAREPEAEEHVFLRNITLFKGLSDSELERLEASMKRHLCLRGEEVVGQGDPGDSLFVVKEGLLDVVIRGESGEQASVAHLVPASFFGEMSLLTGAVRGATVRALVDSLVYEIGKADFEPLVRSRPEIIESLSRMLADRQRNNEIVDSARKDGRDGVPTDSWLLERMKRMFLGDADRDGSTERRVKK